MSIVTRQIGIHIPTCLFAYRNAVHANTGYTPFYLMYLRNSNMPVDIVFEPRTSQYIDVEDYLKIMKERMTEAWQKANLSIKYHQEQMKETYDKNTKNHNFKIGDKVMLEHKACTKGLTLKLNRIFKGPYLVEKTNETNLIIRLTTKAKA